MLSMSSEAAELATVLCSASPMVNVCSTLFLFLYKTEMLMPLNSLGYMV